VPSPPAAPLRPHSHVAAAADAVVVDVKQKISLARESAREFVEVVLQSGPCFPIISRVLISVNVAASAKPMDLDVLLRVCIEHWEKYSKEAEVRRGCVAVWLCGCVAVWLRGCVAVWLRGCVAVWLRGCVAVWLCGCVAV
jgi:hypothetical protein